MDHETSKVGELMRTIWFWTLPFSGGVVDYAMQALKGTKPWRPTAHTLVAIIVHLSAATFFGAVSGLSVAGLGYEDAALIGAFAGMGGFFGVRVGDLLFALMKQKIGGAET